MTVLNEAKAVFFGDTLVDRVFLGDALVWGQLPVVTYADRIKSLRPVSYWRLGEPPGAPGSVDEMHLSDATYTGNPTLGAVGLLAGDDDDAMQVFGVIAQGASPGNPQDYWLQTVTLEAWIKTVDAGASYRGIVVKQDGYGLFAVNNMLSAYEWATGQEINTGVSIADGLIHHVVCVFQPTGSQLYLDGVPRGSAFNHTTLSHSYPLTIGYAQFSGQEFSGILDDVAVYNRALTPAEILGNYQAGGIL